MALALAVLPNIAKNFPILQNLVGFSPQTKSCQVLIKYCRFYLAG
jgi:hypothetical protein